MTEYPALDSLNLVLDLDGQAISVGNRIAYAVTQGRSGQLRIGKVIEIVWEHKSYEGYRHNDVPTKLRVEVETSAYGSNPEKPVLINAEFRRFVKLG